MPKRSIIPFSYIILSYQFSMSFSCNIFNPCTSWTPWNFCCFKIIRASKTSFPTITFTFPKSSSPSWVLFFILICIIHINRFYSKPPYLLSSIINNFRKFTATRCCYTRNQIRTRTINFSSTNTLTFPKQMFIY